MPDIRRDAFLTIVVCAIVATVVTVAYQALPDRAFAADDFQWLLNIRALSLPAVVVRAFDVSAESHFYRPLVWLFLWSEWQLFGFDAGAFHRVSLALHVINATLAGSLTYRIIRSQPLGASIGGFLTAALIAALHPAPFEAVVWVSAQSELLATLFLLLMLHAWWNAGVSRDRVVLRRTWRVVATGMLVLALLTKESAIIGLPLMVLIEWEAARVTQRRMALVPLVLPFLVTVVHVAAALDVASRNYLVRESGYGIGVQIVLNPLRSLGLIAAPLPGVEYGREAWLPVAGAGVALAGVVALAIGWRTGGAASLLNGILALGITLAPTAPFASAPDSRYLYMPVMVIALIIGGLVAVFAGWGIAAQPHADASRRVKGDTQIDEGQQAANVPDRLRVGRLIAGIAVPVIVAAWLGVLAVNEIRGREVRFAAGARPGEELRLYASEQCAIADFDRMLIVEPPIAPPHVEAIIRLSCGSDLLPMVIGASDVERELRPKTLVIVFDGGFPRSLMRTPPR